MTHDEMRENFKRQWLDAERRPKNAELLWRALVRGNQVIPYRESKNGRNKPHYQLRPSKDIDDQLVPIE